MSKQRKALLCLVLVTALGWGGYKFVETYSSYGPFEVIVDSGDRQLEDIVVVMAMYYYMGHGLGSTYKEVRFGKSNEPIHFPRGWVSFWANEPVMSVTVFHPNVLGITRSLSPPLQRFHQGVWQFEPLRVKRWEEIVEEESANYAGRPKDELHSRIADLLRMHYGTLDRNYVKHFPPGKRSQLAKHIPEILRTFEISPLNIETDKGRTVKDQMKFLIRDFEQASHE